MAHVTLHAHCMIAFGLLKRQSGEDHMTERKRRNICTTGLCAVLLLGPASSAWADNSAAAIEALQQMSNTNLQ